MTKQEHLDQCMPYGPKCNLCGGKNHPYMLDTDLWNRLFPKAESTRWKKVNGETVITHPGFFACINCVEKKLGRDLVYADFLKSEPPINLGIFGFDARLYCSLPREAPRKSG